MAGEQLAQAIQRLRIHREAMAEIAAQVAAEHEETMNPKPPEGIEEEERSE